MPQNKNLKIWKGCENCGPELTLKDLAREKTRGTISQKDLLENKLISKSTLKRLVDTGKVKKIKAGGQVYYNIKELREFFIK